MAQGLLLIDIQNDYFPGGAMELVNPLGALDNAEKLLAHFRKQNLLVIHVQHVNMREGATFFLPNTEGAKIHKKLTPQADEDLVIKHAPSSFFQTNLLEILKEKQIDQLIVAGMMTHMCIDTTVRAAKDYGLEITVAEDACATKDLVFDGEVLPAATVQKVFMAGLNGMFAKVVKTKKLL